MKKTLAQERGITEFPYIINDELGRITYYEDETGYWFKHGYDEFGVINYAENSHSGITIDNRPKSIHDLKTKQTSEALEALFTDLSKNAYDVDEHRYKVKEVNMIVRKHWEALENGEK